MAYLIDDDVDDIFNRAEARVTEWADEVIGGFNNGTYTRTADTVWNAQPEEVKNNARAAIPDAASLLDSLRSKSNGSNTVSNSGQ
jgi:hypothetical protein